MDIRRLLGRGDEMDSETVQNLMQQLWILQRDRPQLFEQSTHTIKERNANDTKRYDKLLQYSGPDQESLEYLASNYQQWIEDPKTFWAHQTPTVQGVTEAHARITNTYIGAKRTDL
ncbi:hypothetical protein K431DRAFT_305034 [Polychaeton citri CBS 116435]|uniref:Uncharacterized protein n=1 Tax=Polychaeton citri CBS 116435 TaxID=1314669 RepID=A0A9P4Q757_9PEZI|nr:hypothetical protein K431DRAFT_305034 [Polychaeton citri CBS 116435]